MSSSHILLQKSCCLLLKSDAGKLLEECVCIATGSQKNVENRLHIRALYLCCPSNQVKMFDPGMYPLTSPTYNYHALDEALTRPFSPYKKLKIWHIFISSDGVGFIKSFLSMTLICTGSLHNCVRKYKTNN